MVIMKPLALLTNLPTLWQVDVPVPQEMQYKPPFVLRGQMEWQGEYRWLTFLFEAYPALFGQAVGQASREALDMRAQATVQGTVVPMLHAQWDQGNPMAQAGLQEQWQLSDVQAVHNGIPSEDELYLDDDCYNWPAVGEVMHCGGAWSGMLPQEHYERAKEHCKHGGTNAWQIEPEPSLQANIPYMSVTPKEQILGQRAMFLEVLREWQKETLPIAKAWAAQVPPECSKLYETLNIPLLKKVFEAAQVEDMTIIHDLFYCFPVIGEMPHDVPFVRPGAWGMKLEESEVMENQEELKQRVFAKLREYEYSHDVKNETVRDAEAGFMTMPQPVETLNTSGKVCTRRLPVREVTFKRDISKAYRRCPNVWHHAHLTWTTYVFAGIQWVSRHIGSCFGNIPSVWNFHLLGQGAALSPRRLPKLLICRYVDDYFGVDLEDVPPGLRAGDVVDEFTTAVGYPTDLAKSNDERKEMQVLGVQVEILDEEQQIAFSIQEDKAVRWSADVHKVLTERLCPAGIAAKLAGRFSSVVTTSMNQCGRAYVRAYYAQAAAPMPREEASPWMLISSWFWMQCSSEQPRSVVSVQWWHRPRTLVWTDAAGDGGLSVVIWRQDIGLRFTRTKLLAAIVQQLMAREDNQIGVMETIIGLLLLATYGEVVRNSLCTMFVDNVGSMFAWIRGGSKAPEQNIFVGQGWLHFSMLNCYPEILRVESGANLADVPSRGDDTLLKLLGAQGDAPQWPSWITDFWSHLWLAPGPGAALF